MDTTSTTTTTTIINGKTKDRSQNLQPTAMDAQRQQQPIPVELIVRLPLPPSLLRLPSMGLLATLILQLQATTTLELQQ